MDGSDTSADTARLRAAVDALDPVVALLSLVHLTGERSLVKSLGGAFVGTERSDGFMFSRESATTKADPAVVAEVRERLVRAMLKNPVPLLRTPDRALFKQMAELCLDTELDDDACAMGREQSGFSADEGALDPTRVPPEDFSVLVLGAGMVGINAGLKLKSWGFKFRILERDHQVGGTWSTNIYPNAAVDTPSVQYSFSFALNASWAKYYPRGPEYLAYLKAVTERYGLEGQIDFDTEVQACEWDEARRLWKVTCTRNGQSRVYEANAIVSAFGMFTRPSSPDIPTLDRFRGRIVHAAEWDPSIVLEGKRVVVVGTGATAAQVVTAASAEASRVTVVQRQPNYFVQDDKVLMDVPEEVRWGLENIPFVLNWTRFQSMSNFIAIKTSLAKVDPEWRARTGGISPLIDGAQARCVSYIEAKFADRPDLRAKLTPDFPFFAKRPILDCGFYDALKMPNVELIEGALAACDETAAILGNGTRIECDVIILATGYTVEFTGPLDIRGRGGRSLAEVWTPYPYAYLSLEVPGFPNFFITSGPNSALSSPHALAGEEQVNYIVESLKVMVERDLAEFEVTEAACSAFCARVSEELEGTVWVNNGSAHGYYRHASGRVVIGFPWSNVRYWRALRQPVLADHVMTPREEGSSGGGVAAHLPIRDRQPAV
jgi:cation diffusion facilitator CzcD-associated flavoprotein CzcO